jgi:predicted dinucleotide-utilizing enzyme
MTNVTDRESETMVKIEVRSAIRELSEGKLTEKEFKQRLLSLQDVDGGNYYTISGAISGSLGDIYTEEFRDRVKRLAVEANQDFGCNIDTSDL